MIKKKYLISKNKKTIKVKKIKSICKIKPRNKRMSNKILKNCKIKKCWIKLSKKSLKNKKKLLRNKKIKNK